MSAAHIPSRLEPTGLLRSDGKRPDGATLAPWSSGCLLVWDATCPDTFAISYRAQATSEAGRVAESAEDRKAEKYRGLPASHSFTPVAIETLGAIGPRSMLFLRDLGRRIALESGEVLQSLQCLTFLLYAEVWLSVSPCHTLGITRHTLEVSLYA